MGASPLSAEKVNNGRGILGVMGVYIDYLSLLPHPTDVGILQELKNKGRTRIELA